MTFVDKYVKEILALEVALFHAKARMEADSDDEALHDLRIAIRRIRSLLIPVRSVPGMGGLREAAAQVGRLTTPTRDLEVMAAELDARDLPEAASARRARLKADYKKILVDPALRDLFEELDQWPSTFRATDSGGDSKKLSQLVVKALSKHVDRLHLALNNKAFDRHELRILVKRTRYLTDAFPDLSPLSSRAAKSLKSVQSALGSWHDHFQWCLKAEIEPDLLPVVQVWADASVGELAEAEVEIKKLAGLLPKLTKKKATQKAAPQKGVSL